MDESTGRGNVLVISDDEKPAERLCRWVASAGEVPVLVQGADKAVLECGDDTGLDLVITDLDTDAPDARRVLDRLLEGDLLFGVPQLHVLRDLSLREHIQEINPDVASVSMAAPPEASEFQARVRLAAEVGRLRREIGRVSMLDDLTGGYNRRHLQLRLEQEVARSRRYHLPLSLVLFHVDDVRGINERQGIEIGDAAIRHVAQLLQPRIRASDIFGRWGETSFLVAMPGQSHRGAAVFANRMRGEVETASPEVDGRSVSVRLSGGISATHGAEELTAATMVGAAERALDRARERGGNRVFIDESALAGQRRSILLVDADADILDPAEDLLALDDMEVRRAESADQALRMFEKGRPDLMVIDLRLNDADGGSLLDTLQARSGAAPIPVVGLGGAAETDQSTPPPQPRVDRYLTKPFSVVVLRSLARELLSDAAVVGRDDGE